MTDETLGAAPIRSWIGVGLLVALALACVWVWVSNARETSRFEQALGRFEAPPEWILVAEAHEPARKICLGADGCPSSWTRWTVPAALTPGELEALLAEAGWEMSLDEHCPQGPEEVPATEPADSAEPRRCGAHGSAEGYAASVLQQVSPETGLVELVVRLSPRDGGSWYSDAFNTAQ